MSRSPDTMIPITKHIRKKLRQIGQKAETYDDVIRRLIKKKEMSK